MRASKFTYLFMVAFRVLILFLVLSAGSADAFADANSASVWQLALSVIPSEYRRYDGIWAFEQGDLNGDGIPDVAMVLTDSPSDGRPEERLFVLAGNLAGGYSVLSVSDEFCHPRQFYNLSIAKNSLFVQAVEKADGAGVVSYTLQFRYNAKQSDLELIGKEVHIESNGASGEQRTRFDYLTGKLTRSTTKSGRVKVVSERFVTQPLQRLNGYVCVAERMVYGP